ncbi:MAG: hypothetical protein RL358_1583 [Pseudomonadota bacterium]
MHRNSLTIKSKSSKKRHFERVSPVSDARIVAAKPEKSNSLRVAKDYANLSLEQRDKTLVITSTNADRAAINREVRDNLKASGQLGDGKQVEIMSKSGLTKEEMTKAINFEKGQKVEFTKDALDQGFEKGMQGTVTGIDSKTNTNTVSVKMDDGRKLSFNPEKLQGKELYKASESKEFSKGDKIAFTKNNKDLNVKNGQTGTIEKMEGSKMTVKMENGEKRQFDTKDFKHIDHAYAMTSHKSQGQTFDKVMVHHNTNAGHGDRETYVNVTRAREDVKYYTQDSNKAAKQAGEKLDKESATGSSKSSMW